MKHRPMLNIFLVFILSLLLWSCVSKSKNNNQIKNIKENEKLNVKVGKKNKELLFTFGKIIKTQQKRIWKKIKFNLKFKIGGIDKEVFLYPSIIKTDKFKNIYVLDNLDQSVKKFDRNGKFLVKYGKKGKGPGEFISAFDFDIYENETVAILGTNDNKFAVFVGDKIIEYKTKLMPLKLCFVSSDEIVTFQITDAITMSPFQRINYKNNSIEEYENILDKESFGGESVGMLPFLLGDIHRFKSDGVVYVSAIMGYVILYNSDGDIIKVFKLIDNVKDTGLSQRKNKIKGMDFPLVRFPRLSEYLFSSSNIFGNNLFILSNQASKKPGELVIDIYSLLEGKYKYSLLLKGIGEIVKIYFTDNEIYIVKKNTEVEVFEYKFVKN